MVTRDIIRLVVEIFTAIFVFFSLLMNLISLQQTREALALTSLSTRAATRSVEVAAASLEASNKALNVSQEALKVSKAQTDFSSQPYIAIDSIEFRQWATYIDFYCHINNASQAPARNIKIVISDSETMGEWITHSMIILPVGENGKVNFYWNAKAEIFAKDYFKRMQDGRSLRFQLLYESNLGKRYIAEYGFNVSDTGKSSPAFYRLDVAE